MFVNMIFTVLWVQEQIAGWSQGMGTDPGSTYGTRSSVETAPGTHVLDHAQNTIKKGSQLKNAQWMANGCYEWMSGNWQRKKMAEMNCQVTLSIRMSISQSLPL
jgi:hypothetical protein